MGDSPLPSPVRTGADSPKCLDGRSVWPQGPLPVTQVTPSLWEKCGWEGAQPRGEALTLLPAGLSCLVVAMVKSYLRG